MMGEKTEKIFIFTSSSSANLGCPVDFNVVVCNRDFFIASRSNLAILSTKIPTLIFTYSTAAYRIYLKSCNKLARQDEAAALKACRIALVFLLNIRAQTGYYKKGISH